MADINYNFLFLKDCEKKKNRLLERFQTEKITIDNQFLCKVLEQHLADSDEGYKIFADFFDQNEQRFFSKFMKNEQKSIENRLKGNKLLLKKTHDAQLHEEVWKLYSKSIGLARKDSEEAACAYGNRSFLLLHLKKYEDSIGDIDRAVAITKSNPLRIKMLCRKLTCLSELGREKDEKLNVWLEIEEALSNLTDKSDKKLIKAVEQSKLLFNQDHSCSELKNSEKRKVDARPLPSSPIESNLFVPKYDQDIGRHYLIATQDLRPGSIVSQRLKPYVTACNSKKFYAYCSHCLALAWSAIPCDNCRICMYCTEKCKNEAWKKYHDVECAILPYIQVDDPVYYHFVVGIKSVIMGIKEMGTIEELEKEVERVEGCQDPQRKGLTSDGKFDNKHLSCFYNLPIQESRLKFLAAYLKSTCFLLVLLVRTTDWFAAEEEKKGLKSREGKELARNARVIFVGALLLRFMLIASANAQDIYEADENCDDCVEGVARACRRCSRGTAITPILSLLSNDCNPNSQFIFTDAGAGSIVLACVSRVKENERLSISRFGTFYDVDLRTRRTNMKSAKTSSAAGLCFCEACERNWPSMNQVVNQLVPNSMNYVMSEHKALGNSLLNKWMGLIEALATDEKYSGLKDELPAFFEDADTLANLVGQPHLMTCTFLENVRRALLRLYAAESLKFPDTC